jgi:hypothetical protein
MASDAVTLLLVETVYRFFPGERLTVGHAEFRAANRGAATATLEIVAAAFVVNDTPTALASFHAYIGTTDIGRVIRLAPSATETIRITFPERGVGASAVRLLVRVELLVDAARTMVRDCPIRVIIEHDAQ